MGDNLYQYVFDHMILCAISYTDLIPIRILTFLITCLWLWFQHIPWQFVQFWQFMTFYWCDISLPLWFVEILNIHFWFWLEILIIRTWLTLQTCIILHIIDILISFSGIDWIISKESFRFLIHIIRMLMLTLLCSYVFGRKTFSSPTVNHCKIDHLTIPRLNSQVVN